MTIKQRIDDNLWPYRSRPWVYPAMLVAYFLFLAGSSWAGHGWPLLLDPAALVLVVLTIQSRERYLLWRGRTHRARTCRGDR